MDPYNEAHLFVSAVRIVQYQTGGVPGINDVCSLLNMSAEAGNGVCRKLEKLGIVSVVEDAFSLRVSIENHLEIEKLPRESNARDDLAQEIEQFQANKQDMDKKVEAIQAELKQKRQSMFSDIEKKLKKQLEK